MSSLIQVTFIQVYFCASYSSESFNIEPDKGLLSTTIHAINSCDLSSIFVNTEQDLYKNMLQ